MTQLKQNAIVKTNKTPGSVCTVNVQPVTFAALWNNYVTGDPYRDPKTGKVPPSFENQCALRMSATFHKVGVKMLSFSAKVVKPAPGPPKNWAWSPWMVCLQPHGPMS